MRRVRPRRAAGCALAVLGLGALGLWLCPRGLVAAARFLDVSGCPASVDYALVLGGDVSNRPFAAAAMYRAGRARAVVVTRTVWLPEVEDGLLPPEEELATRVLQTEGVATADIAVLPGRVGSTYDEAVALSEFLAGRPESTVAVVSTSYHLRRARWIFRRILDAEKAERLWLHGRALGGVLRGHLVAFGARCGDLSPGVLEARVLPLAVLIALVTEISSGSVRRHGPAGAHRLGAHCTQTSMFGGKP